jgi:hypothetical protein
MQGGIRMREYELEIPGTDSWAVSMALVEEFIHSWRAEVLEYDITRFGGAITLSLPNDREFRIARTKAQVGHFQRFLEASDEILSRSRGHSAEVRTYLKTARMPTRSVRRTDLADSLGVETATSRPRSAARASSPE